MNIGIVTHAYYPHFGGVTENVSGVARALRQLGHRVLIITAEARGAEPEQDLIRVGRERLVPWNGASVNFTYGARLEARLRAIYREARLDLIHIHCPLSPMLPLAGLRAADGWPVVGMFHATARSNLGYQVFQPYLRREFDRITVATAVSEPAREFVARTSRGPITWYRTESTSSGSRRGDRYSPATGRPSWRSAASIRARASST